MSRASSGAQAADRAGPSGPGQRFSRFAALTRRWPRLLSAYPPFLGAGIRVTGASSDWRYVRVELRLRWWNRNLVGTHFGGSLYAMTDPFYVIMLAYNLDPGYVVWDRAATVHFRRPGRGTVAVEFRLTRQQIEEIRAAADRDGRTNHVLTATVRDPTGATIAEVEKTIYVRAPAAHQPD